MAQDLSNLSNEQLMQMAGIAPVAPSSPVTPRQIIGAPPPKPESPPSGYRVNAQGNLEPIPGGPADPNAKKAPKTEIELRNQITDIQDIRDQIRDTMQYVKPQTTELGAYTGMVPGLSSFFFPDASVLNSRLGQLGGQATLDKLAEIKSRAEGNPLAGPISDRDAKLVEQSAANLNQTDKTDELRRNLLRYDHALENWQRAIRNQEKIQFSQYLEESAKREATAPKVGEVSTVAGAESSKVDPALAGINAKVRAMIKAGVDAPTIRDYLNNVKSGLGDSAAPSLNAVERWRAANPNYRGGYKVDLEREFYKTTPSQSIIGKVATSAPGAYAIQAANTLALGNLAKLTSNPEETQAIMSGLEQQRPVSSALGQVSGSVIGALGPTAALRAAGVSAPLAVPAGEAVFGAGTGASAAGEGNRIKGALAGAGLSVAGSAFGSGVAKLGADIVSPVVSKEVRLAAKSEIPMSLGTMLGGKYKAFEDRLANVIPFFDSKLQSISDQAAITAQRKVFDEVLQPIGAKLPKNVGIGEQAFNHLDNVYNNEYRNLYNQMNFKGSVEVDQKISDLVNEVRQMPGLTNDEVSQFNRELQNVVIGPITRRKGYLTGDEFGKMMSNLKTAKRSAYSKSDQLGSALNDLQGILEEGAVASTKNAEVGKRYRNLSDSYRKFLIVQTAAKSPQGEIGEFTGSKLRSAATTAEGAKAATTGQSSLINLGRMMQAVTPPGATGSQTARNLAIGGLLGAGGANMFDPEKYGPTTGAIAGATGLAALPFLLGSSGRLNPAMRALIASQRPAPVQSIANFARKVVAPAAAGYGRQTLLDQYAQSQEEERLRQMAMGLK